MQISSRFPTPQELLDQVADLSSGRNGLRPAEAGLTTPAPLRDSDSFEKATPAADKAEANGLQQESGGLRIAYHFDLFYQLSQKVQARMGQSGQQRFVETAASVSETFKGSFSLQIDAVGSFLNGTDKSLNISPETANQFMDAVDGLAELSPDGLQNFLKESDKFFGELEKTYGEAGGAFDDINARMKAQATAFFDSVKTVREDSGLGPEGLGGAEHATAVTAAVAPAPAETAGIPEPASLPEKNPGKTFPLSVGPQKGSMISNDQYQEFIQSFLKYIARYRERFFQQGGMPAASAGTEPASPAGTLLAAVPKLDTSA